MAIIEIIMGERPPTGVEAPIQYAILSEDFGTTIDGKAVREPVAPLRERFAKLKARDALLGAVLARLGAGPGARESEAHNAMVRLLNAQTALEKLAEGLGLKMDAPKVLVMQILAMNTELSSALAKAEAKRDEAIAEAIKECKGRADAEAEVRDLTSALEKVRRERDEERLSTAAEIAALTRQLGLAKLDLGRAYAHSAGLAAELDALWGFIKQKFPA